LTSSGSGDESLRSLINAAPNEVYPNMDACGWIRYFWTHNLMARGVAQKSTGIVRRPRNGCNFTQPTQESGGPTNLQINIQKTAY